MKANTPNVKTLLANNKNIFDIVSNGIEHLHKTQMAMYLDTLGIKTLKQFLKHDFEQYAVGNMSMRKITAYIKLQTKLNKYMATQTKPVAKKKKVVAKRKAASKRQSLKDKVLKQYKIVTNYSESLLQDIYSVVYRTKTLKRFVNENLANKYIEQEVLLKMNEKAVASPEKIKGIKKELEQEFA
jgi:hypothetical protein